jgi:hypothetical protein
MKWGTGSMIIKLFYMFTSSLNEPGQLKGQEVHIIFEDDNANFKWPYKFNEVEGVFVWA